MFWVGDRTQNDVLQRRTCAIIFRKIVSHVDIQTNEIWVANGLQMLELRMAFLLKFFKLKINSANM